MKIIEELLSSLDYDVPVRDIRMGPFQTAVYTGNCGLASTPHGSAQHHSDTPVPKAGSLLKEDARALARMALSSSESEAAIGLATINSLLEIDEERCTELNAADLLIEKGKGKKVVIVGHFPFIPRLRQSAGELQVLELQPQPGDLHASEAGRVIPEADILGITGTALTNGTMPELLELCRPDSFVVVLGGTAPLSPILFDYGVDAVSGTKVIEPETILDFVSQGATFRQIRKGVRLLTMVK